MNLVWSVFLIGWLLKLIILKQGASAPSPGLTSLFRFDSGRVYRWNGLDYHRRSFESTFIRILALANQWREIEQRIVM